MVTAILEGIPKIVIFALADDLESATEVAVSVTLGGFGENARQGQAHVPSSVSVIGEAQSRAA